MFNILIVAGIFLTGFLVISLRQYILFYLIPRQLLAAETILDQDPRQALMILGKVRALDRHNPKVHWLAARAHLKNKQHVLAKMHLFDILHAGLYTEEITEQMIRESLASIYRDLDDAEKALLQYYLLREHKLLSLQGYKAMIHILIDKGSLPQAEQILNEAKSKNPLDGEFLYLDALCHFEKKDFQVAEARAIKAGDLFFRSYDLTLLLAKLFFINKKFSRALTLFQSLPEEYLPPGELGNLVGQCFFHIQDYGAAIEMLEANLKDLREGGRDVSETAFVLASAYENLGKVSEALKAWKEIQEKNPLRPIADEKIRFYEDIFYEPSLRKLLTLPPQIFRASAEELLKKIGYAIKERLSEDEKTVEYLCTNKDHFYNLDQHLVSITRQTAPFKQADLDKRLRTVQIHKIKYLCILAPYIAPVLRAGLTDEWTRLIDFEIFLTEGIVKKE